MRWAWVLLVVWSGAWATDWYVRPASGEYGAEDGSSYAAAFDGFADIDWTSVAAGDTVYICGSFGYDSRDGGTATMLSIDDTGTEGSPITFEGDCSAQGDLSQAIIDAENNASAQRGIWARANTDIALRNIRVQNINNATHALGVQMYNATTEGATAKRITLYNVDVYNILGASLSFKCIGGYGTNISVSESDISNCSDDGVFLQGANNSVIDSRIALVSQETEGGDCVQITGNGTVDSSGALVDNVDCDHSDNDFKQCFTFGIGLGSEASAIRDSKCVLPTGGTTSNGIYVEHNATIERNDLRGGNIGISTGAGAVTPTIRANTVIGTTERAISTGSAATGAQILNNSASDCNDGTAAGGCIVVDANNAGVLIANNALSGSLGAGIDVQGASVVEQYNLVHNATTPKSTNCSTVGCAAQAGTLDGTDLTSAPLWVDASPDSPSGFRLTCASPLRNAGTDVGRVQDYGNRLFRIGTPSIGAWEHAEGDERCTITERTTSTARTTVTPRTTITPR